MKTPESLVPLLDSGIIQEVTRPLMSGKEAQVYVVQADGVECVAKVYKEASQRTFKHRSEYTEGRRARNSRDQRAMNKRSKHGRKQDEAGWRSTEVDMIYRLAAAGVRVPAPINFVDGVLVMELVKDADGDPAPRLGDLRFEPAEAVEIYQQLLRETVRMLATDVIHGDLSEFNVLMGATGPVVIDFPQSIEAAANQNARKLLIRDVANLHRFVRRFAPEHKTHPYAEEMWLRYENGKLEPESELRGDYRGSDRKADVDEVMALIEDAGRDENERREARGEEPTEPVARPLRRVVDFSQEAKPRGGAAKSDGEKRRPRPDPRRKRPAERADAKPTAEPRSDGPAKKRRGRRRRSGTSTRSDGERQTETRAPRGEAGAARPERTRSRSAKPAASGEKGSGGESRKPRRSRRRGGSGGRREGGETTANARPEAKRPTRPANSDGNARGDTRPKSEDGASRPRRSRRRRPRNSGSPTPT